MFRWIREKIMRHKIEAKLEAEKRLDDICAQISPIPTNPPNCRCVIGKPIRPQARYVPAYKPLMGYDVLAEVESMLKDGG